MPTIIASKPNAASMNIASRLLENFEWKETGRSFDNAPILKHGSIEFAFTETLHVFADNVASLDSDCFVFVSSHKSEAGKPTLSTHPVGNWGKAGLGGRDATLVPTSPAILKNFLLGLQEKKEQQNLPFEVSLECSHHGPFLGRPVIFIEIGSSPREWNDEKAALAVAEVVMGNIEKKGSFVNCIGLGGQHYPSEFSKLVLRTNFAVGHMCPKHKLQNLDAGLLQQAIECSNAEKIVLDWKGLGQEKQRILGLAEKTGCEVLRVRNLLK
jgi:D-aminoacyl-tRNA deacylase